MHAVEDSPLETFLGGGEEAALVATPTLPAGTPGPNEGNDGVLTLCYCV